MRDRADPNTARDWSFTPDLCVLPVIPGEFWCNRYEPNHGMVVVMHTYDEAAMIARLALLDRAHQTAFAAACAERLAPLFLRHASGPDRAALRLVIDEIWRAVGGGDIDLRPLEKMVEGLVPDEDGEWAHYIPYMQNAAASSVYAIRAWLTNDPKEAARAARQVYEAADYAGQQTLDIKVGRADDFDRVLLEHPVVQASLAAIDNDLNFVETSNHYPALARRAAAEGESSAGEVD